MIPSNSRNALLLGVALGLFVAPVIIRTVARKASKA